MTVAAPCVNHADRDAIGVCVECRTRVCAECSTKIDGVNHCVSCFAALGAASRPVTASVASSSPYAWIAVAALLAGSTLLTWALLEVALPG